MATAKSAMKAVSSIFRSQLFHGKSAIVTGGGTGIGKAITQELLYLGCNVLIASRKLEHLEDAAAEMRQQLTGDEKPSLEILQCNIREEEQVKNMIDVALSKFDKVDFLVNNAGGQFFSPASKFSLKGWNAVIETNLTGTFLCCKEGYNSWMQENGGSIVNMVATMRNGWPGMSHSGAARAAVDNLTKSLAVEWAPSGVRMNAVAPGATVFSDTAASNYTGLEIFERQIPRVPAKRLCKTEEVSAAVMFLLSPAAAFITGETVTIDGAQSLVSSTVPWEVPEHNKLPAYTWESDAKR